MLSHGLHSKRPSDVTPPEGRETSPITSRKGTNPVTHTTPPNLNEAAPRLLGTVLTDGAR